MNVIVNATPETITGDYYFKPEIYDRELDKIFARSWQYVGHVSMLETSGRYLVREVAGESILILRASDDTLKAFYNVCQHRAHHLLEGEGKIGKLIRCPYHQWGYDEEGRLQVARGTEDIPDFDKTEICLKGVRLEILCGFLFVNLDEDARPLTELADGLEEEMRAFSPAPENLKVSNRYHIDMAANWKNSIENYCECYHCPNQHPTLSQNALDLNTYRIQCYDYYHVHRSQDKGADMGYTIDETAARPNEFRSFFLWPNTVFEVYPGGHLTVFHHVPTGPETTAQHYEWYFSSAEPTQEEQDIVAFTHDVRLEDIPICESVQKGLRSRGYHKGRLVVDAEHSFFSEHSVYDFQQKVLTALAT